MIYLNNSENLKLNKSDFLEEYFNNVKMNNLKFHKK